MVELKRTAEQLQRRLEPIVDLLHKHRVVETLVSHQNDPTNRDVVKSLVHRQQSNELGSALRALHAADTAYLLETVPLDDRLVLWSQVPVELGGDVLWDLQDEVAQGLVEATPPQRLLAMCRHMDSDDLRHIIGFLSESVREELLRSLETGDRDWVRAAERYNEEQVGHHMSKEMVTARTDDKLKQVLKRLRASDELPEQTDKLFVVDVRGRLVGAVPLNKLLLTHPRELIGDFVETDVVAFRAEETVATVALAFERYNLISAPVVDGKGKLIGRLTVDKAMDFVREEAEDDFLKREGLTRNLDLFAPVWASARSRWLWLSVNLLTAFVASRVIGVFEGTIEQLVALATLMPIVASIGGNTGNQTVALTVRGLALEQLNREVATRLAVKEVGIALVNGLIWGSLMGGLAYLLYGNIELGVVMASATLLNLVVAALAGFAVPLTLNWLGRDPALGSSVLLTFATDGMGFFIFLGLATLFLV